jgi:hypothetical protein
VKNHLKGIHKLIRRKDNQASHIMGVDGVATTYYYYAEVLDCYLCDYFLCVSNFSLIFLRKKNRIERKFNIPGQSGRHGGPLNFLIPRQLQLVQQHPVHRSTQAGQRALPPVVSNASQIIQKVLQNGFLNSWITKQCQHLAVHF